MIAEPGTKLTELLAEVGQPALETNTVKLFGAYLALLQRWILKVNLTSIRDEDGILRRHFVESIACARALPAGIGTLLDFGSGGGFPGIPIALCRPEIAVTLAESQNRKAAFLQEAVRTLGISAKVVAGRAESISSRFDCVILRAVDHMETAVTAASDLVKPPGWLALMTTRVDLAKHEAAAGPRFGWGAAINLPWSEERVVAFGDLRKSMN
jgi:16S rRNA (guanine527-N7)-methyltransferase